MADFLSPIKFASFLRPVAWGGRRLQTSLGKTLPDSQAYGESWEISQHPSHLSVVTGGPHDGNTIADLISNHRTELLGATATPSFPWLVKFLDAHDWLSVQVHPDDARAKELWPGEGGKTEMWFILDAAPTSRVYAGLLPGIGPEQFRQAMDTGKLPEVLHSFTPRPGDCVFLPAGTVHAVGGGVLMAEIQQTSDATFRLFDWNRLDAQGKPRQLHQEAGMKAIDWSMGPVAPLHVADFSRPSPGFHCQVLVRCPFFMAVYFRQPAPFPVGGAGRLQTLILLRGQCRIGTQVLRAGEAWVLPAVMPELEAIPEPQAVGLLCNLPDAGPGAS